MSDSLHNVEFEGEPFRSVIVVQRPPTAMERLLLKLHIIKRKEQSTVVLIGFSLLMFIVALAMLIFSYGISLSGPIPYAQAPASVKQKLPQNVQALLNNQPPK